MTQLNTASLLARSVPEALRSASGVDAGENAPATCMHTYIEASAARLVLVAMRAELVVKDCNTPLYVHACVAIISISQKGITESQIAGGSTLGAEAKLVAREGGSVEKKGRHERVRWVLWRTPALFAARCVCVQRVLQLIFPFLFL